MSLYTHGLNILQHKGHAVSSFTYLYYLTLAKGDRSLSVECARDIYSICLGRRLESGCIGYSNIRTASFSQIENRRRFEYTTLTDNIYRNNKLFICIKVVDLTMKVCLIF